MDRLQRYSFHQVRSDTTTLRSARFVMEKKTVYLKSYPWMGRKSPTRLDMYRQVQEVLELFSDRFVFGNNWNYFLVKVNGYCQNKRFLSEDNQVLKRVDFYFEVYCDVIDLEVVW